MRELSQLEGLHWMRILYAYPSYVSAAAAGSWRVLPHRWRSSHSKQLLPARLHVPVAGGLRCWRQHLMT
jgi:hypothetical protein